MPCNSLAVPLPVDFAIWRDNRHVLRPVRLQACLSIVDRLTPTRAYFVLFCQYCNPGFIAIFQGF